MTQKRKILLFIDWFTPAYKAGGPISSVKNLCNLLHEVYDILVVTGDRDLGDLQPLKGISVNVPVDTDGFQVIYLSPEHQNAKKYREIYNSFQPDVIHLNSLFSARFTILPLKNFSNQDALIVISPRGMLGPESLKIKPIKKRIFFVYARVKSWFKSIRWHATSEIEKKEIMQKFGSDADVKIASNVPYISSEKTNYLQKTPGQLNLLSIGRIAPIKNFDFLINCLKHQTQNINLTIVGPIEDQAYFDKCKNATEKLPKTVTVKFIHGVPPSEIEKLYQENHLFISTSKNENFGHSIAEALAHGKPVIVSDHTPWKALDKKGIGFDLKLDLNLFSDKIDYFASMDQEEYHLFCDRAKSKATELTNKTLLIDNYLAVYSL